jgi:hypothetical protein
MKRDIYAELQAVQETFYLKDGKLFRILGDKEITSKTVRMKTMRLCALRVRWQLENCMPVPDEGFVRELNGKIICYHPIRTSGHKCECGHFMVIKDYLTEECWCSKCYTPVVLPAALPGDDCPHCNGFMVPRSSGAGMFLGCSNVTSEHRCLYVCTLDRTHATFIDPEEL